MDISNLLYQGLMEGGKSKENQARFARLTDVHHDLDARFIARVLEQLNDRDKRNLTPRIEKIESLQQHISEHIQTVETRYLQQYAFCLKEAALLAMKLCQKYKVCREMKSFNYNAVTRMIELNGEDLYFLGETKHQTKEKQKCTQCDSDNVVMLSQLHQAETTNPRYAPPKKKFAFFGAFLSCSFLAITWYLTRAGSGETPYQYMLAGLACLAYTAYAWHYNFMKFPAAQKQWQSSFFCNDCGSISVAKS